MTAPSKSAILKVPMTPALKKQLFDAASDRGESAAILAREAIQQYLERRGVIEEAAEPYRFPKRKPPKVS